MFSLQVLASKYIKADKNVIKYLLKIINRL